MKIYSNFDEEDEWDHITIDNTLEDEQLKDLLERYDIRMITEENKSRDLISVCSWYFARDRSSPPFESKYGFIIDDKLYFQLTKLGCYRLYLENLITNPDVGPREAFKLGNKIISFLIDLSNAYCKRITIHTEIKSIAKLLMDSEHSYKFDFSFPSEIII